MSSYLVSFVHLYIDIAVIATHRVNFYWSEKLFCYLCIQVQLPIFITGPTCFYQRLLYHRLI